MGFGEAVRTCVNKSFVWEGRASIAEYWWFALALSLAEVVVDLLVFLLIYATKALLTALLVQVLFAVVTFFPSLAVTIRRLHDTGRNGAWCWIVFIPYIGPIVLFVFMLMSGNPHENRYGPDPYGRQAADPAPDPYGHPAATEPGRPISRPGLHWCATRGCPMYQTNVGQETCYSCGQPTQETEPV